MGRMNIYLDATEDEKLHRLKERFNIKSKEEVIKRLIKQFPEEETTSEIDIEKETSIGDLLWVNG